MIMITMSKYGLIVLGLAMMTSTITTTMTKSQEEVKVKAITELKKDSIAIRIVASLSEKNRGWVL